MHRMLIEAEKEQLMLFFLKNFKKCDIIIHLSPTSINKLK